MTLSERINLAGLRLPHPQIEVGLSAGAVDVAELCTAVDLGETHIRRCHVVQPASSYCCQRGAMVLKSLSKSIQCHMGCGEILTLPC